MDLNRFLLGLKRSKNPRVLMLKRLVVSLRTPTIPRWPSLTLPFFRFLYELFFLVIGLWRVMISKFVFGPMFQSRCAAFGKGIVIEGLPYISGHTELILGDKVGFGGNISIHSGRIFDNPRLVMKDRSGLGWNVIVTVNREVVIEEDVMVSYDCRISDSDSHPREMDLRAMKAPPRAEDVRPVRIGRGAWIGNGAHIMKGVSIGEGAIIAANSVVIMDVPAYSLAMGNPAEIYFRNYGLPSTHPSKRAKKKNRPAAETAVEAAADGAGSVVAAEERN